jgi:hypothetical protein
LAWMCGARHMHSAASLGSHMHLEMGEFGAVCSRRPCPASDCKRGGREGVDEDEQREHRKQVRCACRRATSSARPQPPCQQFRNPALEHVACWRESSSLGLQEAHWCSGFGSHPSSTVGRGGQGREARGGGLGGQVGQVGQGERLTIQDRPMLRMASGLPILIAASARRKDDKTESDDPATSTPAAASARERWKVGQFVSSRVYRNRATTHRTVQGVAPGA